MALDLDEAILNLTHRQTDVAPSAENCKLKDLENVLSVRLGDDFRRVYSMFNGFSLYDQKSHLTLWSLEKIIFRNEGKPIYIDNDDVKWVAIGDFLIDSDLIVATVELNKAKVNLLYEGRVMSSSIMDFIASIATGKFGF